VGLSVRHTNLLEFALLRGLDYELNIHPATWINFIGALRRHATTIVEHRALQNLARAMDPHTPPQTRQFS
jgi:hypothetical protein